MKDNNEESTQLSESTHRLYHHEDPVLLEAFRYINTVPGKEIRSKLIECFQMWHTVDSPQVLSEIKEIVAELHNASLLIDDIQDNSCLRRGQPVAHKIFGIGSVINCANYVYFLAQQRCHNLQNDEAMKVFISEMLNLHRGQGHDIYWREEGKCPTEEEYCNMVIDKTGGLFRLAVGLMGALSTNGFKKDLTPLVNTLGLYFQIRDDFINLADQEFFKLKSFCEDLTEGKYSFPIIHCIRLSEKNKDSRLSNILKQRTEDIEIKKYAQKILLDSGSLKYTFDKCVTLKEEIVLQIEELGGNESLMKVVTHLHLQVAKVEADVISNKRNIKEIS
uniref:Geranylgeranyl diphosphate synthase n=1 Tax=Eucampia antarctica TaxID=49252 RepID=A0A7S2W1W8_9STRA|mmetsp:Transcript_18046/g.17398  ORF Transcript_18046/g.17398 Transcript_18046/m.17398 type:complete len:333 (+) Transcript_18046:98-1096(+)|eukprot:CAMPEP_0197842254 /NCGR_PEP_ID=MMETSP1437-20131217/46636_1 /TAXON_ID=49252 ORGANISM="Eucampia antarctica, Strain CCMP1452" /NCGR_SAMPLE_ID=MMETSP1437 /ASSEMBLY_ACC=CAM_ASM_001096 /LENGTH=332 /DNA_ID=CAMNT_0043452109 /DNA_START=76 /DNA_END=1074 /DNA_ORIENTATION=-